MGRSEDRATPKQAGSEQATQDQRRDPRLPLEDTVTIVIPEQSIVGPGRNVSAQGVYFTTSGSVRVQVRIGNQERLVDGELVRVESMGDGGVGIAVRFQPPLPPASPSGD